MYQNMIAQGQQQPQQQQHQQQQPKPQPQPQSQPQTVSHFISAPTQPNSTKFSIQPYFNQTRRFMPKNLVKFSLELVKNVF